MGSTYTLSPALKDVGTTPVSHFMVNILACTLPKISSTRPTLVLFWRNTPALK